MKKSNLKRSQFSWRASKLLLLTLFAVLVGGSPAWADELTAYDGTATNEYLPIHGYYADNNGTASEFIIPAADLVDMKDKVIEQLTFYISSAASKKFGATFNVYLEEVAGDNYDDSSASQLTNSKTLVYTGALDADGTTLVIPFDTEYTYNGGNLLIATEITTKGSYAHAYFYGTTTTFNAGRCNKSSTKRYSFIPKTTFTYVAASPYKKPASISVGEITTTTGVVSWTSGSGDSSETGWNLDYKKSTDENWTEVHGLGASPLSYTLSELEPNTTYDVRVQAVYSGGESNFVATTFKTAKVATPATGFTDNFETDKGWDFVNVGTSSNSWVRGTATNNGGSSAMYISNDGGTSNTYATSGAMAAYAAKLFSFEEGDYTISYDWKANGESTYDFLRVALVPATDELNVNYSSIGSSSLPTGWTELDGGSKLNQKSDWQSVSKDITISEAGSYQIVFAWRNDGSGGSNPPAAIDNFKIIGATPVLELGGDVAGTTLTFGSVAETTNKTIRITNSGKVTMENIALTETADADNVFAYAELPKTTLAANEYMDVQVTFSGSSAKDYTGTFQVAADDCDPIDVTVTATYSNSAATMALTLGEEAVGASVAFGSVGKQTTKTFTVSNDGDQTLNVTSIVSNNTTDFTVSPSSFEIAGHSSETFTVTFVYPNESPVLNAEKTANITITASNEGIDPIVFAVTGTRIEQWSEDFSGTPDGWEITNSTYWKFEDGMAKGSYSYGNYDLVTPSLVVEEGQTMTFDYRMTSTYRSLDIQYSKNNGTWTALGTISYSGLTLNQWYTYTIEGLEAGNYKFRFADSNYDLDNFQGFKRNMNDPKMGIYSDAECTAAVATSVSKDFGFATDTQTANYYIKNDGTGTMTLSLGDNPNGITASLNKTSVTAGDKATLTITMPAANKGYNGGNVVVTAANLGTFTVAVSGVIVDEDKLNLNFASDNIPATWTANDWMKDASGYIKTGQYGYSNTTMETTKLTAEAGEKLVVVAKNGSTSSSYTFGIKYKKVDAEEWSDLIAAANIGNSWTTLVGTIAEAGDYLLQFNGYYAHIQRIYGLSVPQEPLMVVYDGESVAATTYNFGNVSDEADAVKTFTVKNEGKAELKGLAAALTGDNADHYSVEVSATTVAVNGTATITVKQLKDNLGTHAATLTISATGLDSKEITLSGNTYDHTKLFVDFDNPNAIPTGWTVGTSWSVYTYGDDRYAQQSNYSAASALITTPLTVAANETLKFKAARYNNSYACDLKVRYTTDGGLTWSDYVDYASQITSSTFVDLELTGVPAGTAVVEFYGRYVKLDNIYGFTATNAPLFALTESSEAVENGSTKEYGTLTAQATATYTLTNNGNGAMVSTVATTGVATAAISGEGEGITISENTVTLAAGKSATITLTLPYEAPFGEKSGAMTITTEGWVGDFTVNYTATTVDPTALYIDFAGNAKPEGWYQETSGWTFTLGTAHVYAGVDKILITEQYGAESGKNVLSFDAKLSSTYAEGELKVYTSTDRKTWTLAKTVTLTEDIQAVTLDALADGNYYVKFESSNASIDNLSGLKKLTAPEHDLYASATTFPTTTLIPETENGVMASATVYSLRADETGVYAKLFFDETEIATADAQDISKDASKTFNFTANVPATEKTYAAKIVVYYSNNSVAWETTTTNVVVSHTRTLQITNIARTSDATADADGDNQFTSTFNVTVKNTGTVNYNAANVSVSITDAEGNVIGENTTTWNLANSQTVFINPGEYTNDGAVLAIWRYNTDSDGEWGLFTKINDNLYSAERNGKTNFNIVRLKKEGDDGYNSENGGLNWDNKYNQSTDMKNTDGNFFTFKGWDDKDGENNHWFTYGTMSELPINASTTFAVSLTTSALEGGLFTFKAKENMSNTVSTASATVTVNAAAPKFALYQDATPVNDGDDVQFGIVKGDTKDFTFTIRNEGNKMMEKPEMVVPTGFEATYVPADGDVSDWMLFFYKDGTVDADQGNFKATATDGKFIIENVSVPVSGVNFAVHKKNGNDWTDIYGYSDEGGWLDATAKATKLATATNASGWMTIAAGTYDFIWNATDLTLMAKPAGAILAGESQDVNVTLKAEQGKVSGDLKFTYAVDATTNNTFTLALSGRSVAASTWIEEFTTEIPASWTNNGWTWNSDRKAAYSTYSAGKTLMTPRLAAENGEELTFDLYFPYSGYQMKVQYSTDKTNWTEVATYTSTSNEQTIEGSFTAPAAGNYYLLFGDNNSNSKYAYVDNFVGFQLNIPEHDMEIAASAVPTTGKQYNTYTATVSLKENAGKDEAITAKLFVNGADVSADVDVAQANKNATTVVTLTWEPQAVIDEAVKAYVKVTYDGGELTTEEVDLTVAEVYTLDEETSASTIEAVTDETVLLKRTFAEGWNTVCLPFAINDVETFFGIGAKAYEFTSYTDGTLNFATVSSLTASYPFIVYVPAAITEAKKLSNITINSSDNQGWYITSNDAKFQGTYAPIAAPDMEGLWGVTKAAKIAKGTNEASMKGFRAYFELPNGVSAARIAFTNEDGMTTVINAIELDKQNGKAYNLNGQRVENLKKGLYIINGKKQVIK